MIQFDCIINIFFLFSVCFALPNLFKEKRNNKVTKRKEKEVNKRKMRTFVVKKWSTAKSKHNKKWNERNINMNNKKTVCNDDQMTLFFGEFVSVSPFASARGLSLLIFRIRMNSSNNGIFKKTLRELGASGKAAKINFIQYQKAFHFSSTNST